MQGAGKRRKKASILSSTVYMMKRRKNNCGAMTKAKRLQMSSRWEAHFTIKWRCGLAWEAFLGSSDTRITSLLPFIKKKKKIKISVLYLYNLHIL